MLIFRFVTFGFPSTIPIIPKDWGRHNKGARRGHVIAVYLLTLGLSAAIAGAFGHNLLAALGFAPTFDVGLRLALGIAGGYVTAQILFVALVKALKPTRSGKFLLAESLSHGAVLVLLPFLMRIEIPWPDPTLARAAPLVFLAAFLGLHGILKLFSFYTALYCEPSGRLHILGWVGAGCIAAAVALTGLHRWHTGIEAARPLATSSPAMYRVGHTYAEARTISEGAMAQYELPLYGDRALTLRWAIPPGAGRENALERAYVNVWVHGAETTRVRMAVSLRQNGFAVMHVPAEDVPADATRCTVFWTQEPAPSWMRLLGFTPVVRSDNQLLLAGPLLHQERTDETPPNLVIIGIDGLSPAHMSANRYARRTTPLLDRFMNSSVAFPYGYSPCPDASAAYMTLFTGVNPICHGYFGPRAGPLPSGSDTLAALLRDHHYATAAFTEGEHRGDLYFGSGFEAGFDWFDAAYITEGATGGSRRTADDVLEWMEDHRDVKFMVFLRASELADLTVQERYGTNYLDNADSPRDIDVYDTALAHMDTVIGGLVQSIRESEFQANTCILLMSPYAMHFARDGKRVPPDLSEEMLRTPIAVYVPDVPRENRNYIVAIEDVVPALARVAGIELDESIDGRSFLLGPVGKDPVSMMAEPFQLSVRSGNWRFTWQPPVQAFGQVPTPGDGDSRLFRVAATTREVSVSGERQLAADFQERLAEYVRASYTWRGHMPPASPAQQDRAP